MALLEILRFPDPRLQQVSQPVSDFDQALAEFATDLEQTMRAGPGGVGIAAPQVARFIRLIIVDVSSRPKTPNHGKLILVNPEITEWEGMKKGREGCMSVPDYTGNVIRAERVVVSAQNLIGQSQQYQFEGFEARAVQHELDHLDGLLFLDRLVSRRTDLFARQVYK